MPRTKKNVTFQDIADYTHFSKTTISRYFNNPDSLTVENQDKIAEALRVLNYKENKVAKILASGRTEIIGLLIPNMYLHFYSLIMEKILETYEAHGYKFLVFVGSDNPDVERRYINELLAYKIEGLIIMSHTIPSIEIASYNVPVVAIEREDRYISSVNTDNYMGGVQATSLLYKNDCDIFIHINNIVSEETPGYGRIRGFLDTCREHGLDHVLYERAFGTSYEETRDMIHGITDEIAERYPGKRKGVFLSNDTIANLMLNRLIRTVPDWRDEYRLIGFDDAPISSEAIVPISTVGQQVDRIVEHAMTLLITQMDERKKRRPSPDNTPVHEVVAPVLITRETTDPPGEKEN